ncbi:MAG: hypothetical protein JW955_17080 [Sedimentisphaerales bacterium]|nr:hypothetical protein [Sedimentisphaerales bacterium]
MRQSLRTPRIVLAMGMLCLLGVGASGSRAGDGLVAADSPIRLLPYGGFTWEQPPIEIDALSKTPFFCGWDEPAFVEEIPDATDIAASRPVDDFRCPGPMPVASIHWWGSYAGWQQPMPPTSGPDAWRITFYADTPADIAVDFGRPGLQLVQFDVPPERVSADWAAFDDFPDKPQDSCFKYSLALDPSEYFWPGSYDGEVFWIAIAAVYKTQRSDHVWGWKTRPDRWREGAVEFVSQMNTLPSGQAISAIAILPVEGADPCGGKAKYDMTFALDTDPLWIKWEQAFAGLRQWSHYEDESSTARGAAASSIAYKWHQDPDTSSKGVGVDMTVDTPKTWSAQMLADDFECTLSGPLTQIDLWGSFYLDTQPINGLEDIQFTLSIREDIPASKTVKYSMPGKVLWRKTFKKGQFTVQASNGPRQAYYSPCNAEYIINSHAKTLKYSFTIARDEAFMQTGTAAKPVVYWLCAQASVTQIAASTIRFGWKTSTSHWNDDAVWAQAKEPFTGTWQKLNYPSLHARAGEHTALAFAVLTSDYSTSELIDRQVADDWACEQLSPVIAAVWWGSYIGYADKACECNKLATPVRPDYFVLSIWSDSPRLSRADFSHPNQKLWEYKAYQYDEVQVGSDKDPEATRTRTGYEPVFRYSVSIPEDQAFAPEAANDVYWFSVVAVYAYPKVANYPWGWTNHEHVFNDAAVAGSESTATPGRKTWTWQPLEDRTGASEDMSFVLFQQAIMLGEPPVTILP